MLHRRKPTAFYLPLETTFFYFIVVAKNQYSPDIQCDGMEEAVSAKHLVTDGSTTQKISITKL